MLESWKRVRLGEYATVKARLGWKGLTAGEYLEDGFVFLSTPNLKGHQIDFDNVNYIPKWRFDESPEIQLREHDVLIVKDGSTLGTSNFVRRLPRPATVNGSIAVVRPISSLDPEFLYHFVNGEEFQKLITLKRSGLGVPHLFQADLREFPVSLPPLGEQRCISEILSRVSQAIEQTEALIAKQQRIKTGLMQDLLTRGIDEHGNLRSEKTHKFKDSPLGRIPAEWETRRLDQMTRADSPITYGVVQPGREDENGVRFVRGGDIYAGEVREEQLRTISKSISGIYKRTVLEGGEILMSLVGYPGEVAVVPDSLAGANIARQAALIRLAADHDAYFVMYYLMSMPGKRQVFGSTLGSAQQVVNLKELKTVLVPLPRPTEQAVIRTRISATLDALRSHFLSLAKFRLLKAGLMQDLLTGRRRVAALLPERLEATA